MRRGGSAGRPRGRTGRIWSGLRGVRQGAVIVREVPALLLRARIDGMVRDLADELAEWGAALALKERIETVCGT